jgi:hypothetical protein
MLVEYLGIFAELTQKGQERAHMHVLFGAS